MAEHEFKGLEVELHDVGFGFQVRGLESLVFGTSVWSFEICRVWSMGLRVKTLGFY